MIAPGSRQRELFHFDCRPQHLNVYGVFYLGEKRVRRKLAGFDDLGLEAIEVSGEDGESRIEARLIKGGARAEAALTRKLDGLYREMERGISEREKIRKLDGTKIGSLMGEFLEGMEGVQSPITANGYRLAFQKYKEANGSHPIGEIRKSNITKFHKHLKACGLSDATVRTYLTHVKGLLRWLHEDIDPEQEPEKWLQRMPSFPKVRVPKKLPKILSDAELLQLRDLILAKWAAAKGERRKRLFRGHYRVLMICAGAGLRRGEAFNLRWEDIDLINGEITVRMQVKWMVKERREKVLPLQSNLLEFLTTERSANPSEHWFIGDWKGDRIIADANSLTGAFGNLMKEIGIGGSGVKSVHGFRALFITTAFNKLGLDPSTIQHLAGHSTVDVTASYIGKSDQRLRDAVKKFDEIKTGIGEILAKEKIEPRKPLIN